MSVIKLKPATKDYLWGGTKLKEHYNIEGEGIIAEAWVVSAHPDGLSVVESGEYQGLTLVEYIARKGKEVLGTKGQTYEQFPILVKLLDAEGELSVQVHPDDEYGLRHEGEYGKNEMWLILDSKPGSTIYHGVKEKITKEEFRTAIEDGTLLDKLNEVEVKPYDLYNIPAGTIHALRPGSVMAEIQQSSNSTYRIYDYDRVGADGKKRDLHIDKAVDVSILEPNYEDNNLKWQNNEASLVQNEFFNNKIVRVTDTTQLSAGPVSFQAIVVTDGQGTITCGNESIDIIKGNGLFVDANTEYQVNGQVELVLAEVA